jgi:hypothetical protein
LTPTTVNQVPGPAGATKLAKSGDPCEKLLVKTAWGSRVS